MPLTQTQISSLVCNSTENDQHVACKWAIGYVNITFIRNNSTLTDFQISSIELFFHILRSGECHKLYVISEMTTHEINLYGQL